MKHLALPLCCLLAGCSGKIPTFADLGLGSAPKARPVAGYVIDRPKPVMTGLPVATLAAYQPSAPVALASPPPPVTAPVPPPAPVDVSPISAPTPLSSEPPAAVPPAAAPLTTAVPPDGGQGPGLTETLASAPPLPPAPVTRTLALAEALRLLADHHGVRVAHTLIGTPTVEVTGDPGPDLAANLRALLASVTPTYHTAIALTPDGLPAAVLVTPYPIVGAQ